MIETFETSEAPPAPVKRVALVAGPLLAIACLASGPPAGLSPPGWVAAAVGIWMALWWMTEAVPLAATALLPIVLFPLLGVAPIEDVSRPYADPLIFLFLGGFMLAAALQRSGLHRRLALGVTRLGGSRPSHIVASLLAATALLSMFVSNTATAMVMLPIGQSIVASMVERARAEALDEGALHSERLGDLPPAVMLAIAYGATIGGMATIIGTPPNALLVGFMKETYGVSIGFGQWMLIGLPVVLALLPIAWLVLTRIAFRMPPATDGTAFSLAASGPMSSRERRLAILMLLTGLAWVFRPLISARWPGLHISDAGIAMAAALALFVVPAGTREDEALLEWRDLASLRWDVLILFGGGLALAKALSSTGLATWLGSGLRGLEGLPLPVLVLATMFVIVYLGELASNTAVAAVFLPIAGAAAVGIGESPVTLTLPVALAASLGFMLPIATPPNAIVYGSGAVTTGQMLRAGAVLDVVTIPVVAAIGMLLAPLVIAAR